MWAVCIYRYPTMDLNEFNCYYLNPLLEKLTKEQKTVFLLGDFSVNLLKYEQLKATIEFLGSLSSNMFLTYIIQPHKLPPIQSLLLIIFFQVISLRK